MVKLLMKGEMKYVKEGRMRLGLGSDSRGATNANPRPRGEPPGAEEHWTDRPGQGQGQGSGPRARERLGSRAEQTRSWSLRQARASVQWKLGKHKAERESSRGGQVKQRAEQSRAPREHLTPKVEAFLLCYWLEPAADRCWAQKQGASLDFLTVCAASASDTTTVLIG
ncbi:hypothetical protein DL98DRAFT_566089 [Cadophora sp. DSE1049]|nr:hypothetical protein DL98DRAFT_566089 [Cadophora sp. DSE1049]